jgi:multiple sugar transport system permease protein
MKKLSHIQRAIVGLIFATVLIAVILPLMFFVANAFSNSTEIYDYPKTPLMSFTVTVSVDYDEINDQFIIKYIDRKGVSKNAIDSRSGIALSAYFEQYYSVYISAEEILEDFEITKTQGLTEFTYTKNLWHNFQTFFYITSKADEALVNSIVVVIYTIIISLTLGSMCGYAIARFQFKGKDQISVFLLIVRMFPTVGIAIPLAVILIRFQLFDTMIGLAILYSLPNIALTSWITSSIFVGINRELEEASLVFGANGIQTFLRITLPMALPAMAASSMYAFLTAWNDTISALILTNDNPTLALAVYQAIGDNTTNLQYAAAGSIILIIPALIFTFVVRKYVNQMWGSVSV